MDFRKLRDVAVNVLGRGERRVSAPEIVNERLDGDDLVRAAATSAASSAHCFGGAERDLAAIERHRQRPEDSDVHRSPPVR